jgi:hypothetical protein
MLCVGEPQPGAKASIRLAAVGADELLEERTLAYDLVAASGLERSHDSCGTAEAALFARAPL